MNFSNVECMGNYAILQTCKCLFQTQQSQSHRFHPTAKLQGPSNTLTHGKHGKPDNTALCPVT